MASLEELVAIKDRISDRFLMPEAPTVWGRAGGRDLLVAAAIVHARAQVHSVGVGKKDVQGKAVGELCIRFYLSQKLPPSLVPGDAMLPKEVDGVPTDVIESPPPVIAPAPAAAAATAPPAPTPCSSNRQRSQRPLRGGISVAHVGVTAGTIGYFCESTDADDDADDRFILSNNHVLAMVNKGKKGDAVLQQGAADGGTNPAQRVAALRRFKRLTLTAAANNEVDAAIAKIDDGIVYAASICMVGKVTGTASAAEDMEVVKHGRTTGFRAGVISDISLNTIVGGLDPNNPAVVARFRNQIRIDRVSPYPDFALLGDSGALVCTRGAAPKAVGLFFACPINGSYGLANKIDDVLRLLKVKLV